MPKLRKMAKTRTLYRSAVTGRIVKPSVAKKSPRTHVKETVKTNR